MVLDVVNGQDRERVFPPPNLAHVNGQGLNMGCDEALSLAAKVVRHSDPSLFVKLFTVIQGKAKRE